MIDPESIPCWLSSLKQGDRFPRRDFFRSRILFYPGSATDEHPIRYFCQAHAIHCFVYVDYTCAQDRVVKELLGASVPDHPLGYKVIECRHLSEKEITPRGWTPHLAPPPPGTQFADSRPPEGPFALWAVMERDEGLGEDHGPMRWSILHIGGDAIATFDALFCQPRQRLPYAVLLHDHGYGENYTVFGGESSPLWKLIQLSGRRPPEWLLAGNNTEIWPGYQIVQEITHPKGRSLYRLMH